MRLLLRTLTIVFAGLLVTLSLILVVARQNSLPAYAPLSVKDMPGQPLPVNVACQFLYQASQYAPTSCEQSPWPDKLSIVYDDVRGLIGRVILFNPDRRIGDLVLAWGQPLYVQTQNWGSMVYWTDRHVYVPSQAFAPDDLVSFITYDKTSLAPDRHWLGFSNLYAR